MTDPEQGRAAQLRNIEAKTGLSLTAIRAAATATGKSKHGELRAWAMEQYGLGHGDANAVAREVLMQIAPAPDGATLDPLDEIYAGKKAHLRPIHDAVMAALSPFGDFEVAPKKGYVALRRKKQFAMLGPKTAERAELGLNLKEEAGDPRFVAQKPGGMCQYVAALTKPEDVDAALVSVLRRAFDAAG